MLVLCCTVAAVLPNSLRSQPAGGVPCLDGAVLGAATLQHWLLSLSLACRPMAEARCMWW